MPRISVITVCRNAHEVIGATLCSVLDQTSGDFEYLIVDGASSDGTQGLVEPFRNRLAAFISESDQGIYDAMNKGAGLARGEYVIFMNAGDRFIDAEVLASCRPYLDGTDYVFGDVMVKFADGARHRRVARDPTTARRGMPCSHQALFVRRERILQAPFDLSYRIAADYEQLLHSLQKGASLRRIPMLIAEVSAGGVSDLKQMASVSEYIRAVSAHGEGRLADRLALRILRLRVVLVSQLKKILPQTLIRVYRAQRAARTSV